MSITIHFGGDEKVLRPEGEVLSGAVSVEMKRALEAARDRKRGARYRNVGAYDPVLRSHCRLDSEG
jgi:hypothetical protein